MYPELWATQLIDFYRRPFTDASFSKQKREQILKSHFFDKLDFTNSGLVNSEIFTSTVFEYLMLYAKPGLSKVKQEQAFKNAVDIILTRPFLEKSIEQSTIKDAVYEQVLDYLVRGFEKLNLHNINIYIAENYAGTTCQTDAYTTLERKLEFFKMKPGYQLPDFEMNDLNGDLVKFSEICKDTTMLIFWASWCPHCTEMLPHLQKRFQSAKKSNFEIVLVSLDTSKEDWTNFVLNNKLDSFYNLCDFKEWEGEVVTNMNIYATPTILILNKNRQLFSIHESLESIYSYF
jgi:peroxiredoxin